MFKQRFVAIYLILINVIRLIDSFVNSFFFFVSFFFRFRDLEETSEW